MTLLHLDGNSPKQIDDVHQDGPELAGTQSGHGTHYCAVSAQLQDVLVQAGALHIAS
jgi:hypothetical protein